MDIKSLADKMGNDEYLYVANKLIAKHEKLIERLIDAGILEKVTRDIITENVNEWDIERAVKELNEYEELLLARRIIQRNIILEKIG